MPTNIQDLTTYRVEFIGDTAKIICLGIPIAPCEFGSGETSIPIVDMPDWMTRRVAVLSTMAYEPPTEFVTNIGRRIEKYVYWVFYEGDDDGDNT